MQASLSFKPLARSPSPFDMLRVTLSEVEGSPSSSLRRSSAMAFLSRGEGRVRGRVHPEGAESPFVGGPAGSQLSLGDDESSETSFERVERT
jgi:hypothetical protein